MVPEDAAGGRGRGVDPRVRIALTPGDPRGVGPEVGAVAAAGAPEDVEVVLVGPRALWTRAAALRGVRIDHCTFVAEDPHADSRFGDVAALASIATAVRLCLDGQIAALVTGPLHKKRMRDVGFPHPGHTEYLAELCALSPSEAVMVFAGGELAISLATVHVPLKEVPTLLDRPAVERATSGLRSVLQRLGRQAPHLGICGLNPHAGEGGVLGEEDERIVAPVVRDLRAWGWSVEGPLPADSAFARHRSGHYDGLVALYHDQGLGPLKAVDFGRSVNITAGLPIVRTSVDHGTADDIAWTGRADASHTVAALEMAVRLHRGRSAVG